MRKHPHLYEINTWAWLEELSSRQGKPMTLEGVPEAEWDRLRDLGFDAVWLMGIWKRSPASRRMLRTDPAHFASYDAVLPGWEVSDIVGSPYAVQDYNPDPRFGSWLGLDKAREKLHARGMSLILDFVPNHTALDHPWINTHPEYYLQGTLEDFRREPAAFYLADHGDSATFIARGKDPYFPPWPDTAQLNYYNPATRGAMLEVLRRLVEHCDGARCDMAMLSLNEIFGKTWGPRLSGFPAPDDEFWPSVIDAFPNFVWIAEVYWAMEGRLQQLGFHFTYDKGLYDCLLNGDASAVRNRLAADGGFQNKLVRFLENHDERRSAAAFGKERLSATATLFATLPGMRFYHQGQLEGKKLHLPIQLRRAAAEHLDEQIQTLYGKLLAISRDDAFHDGDWRLLEVRSSGDGTFENLIAYQWRLGANAKIVVGNLSAAVAQGTISLDYPIDPSMTYSIRDELNDRTYDRGGPDLIEGGLFVRLEGYQSHVLNFGG
jgi:hypothetical protein